MPKIGERFAGEAAQVVANGICGVYTISCNVSGRVYVGSSIDLPRRERTHKLLLKNGVHKNRHLQAAWNLYGAESFVFDVVERCLPERVIELEQLYIDLHNWTGTPLYNTSPVSVQPRLGAKASDETRAKLSKALKGKQQRLGQKHTEETKEKMRRKATGRLHTDAAKAKMSVSQKLSQERRGPPTAESNAKRSKALIGRVVSVETRAKISAGHKARLSKLHEVEAKEGTPLP